MVGCQEKPGVQQLVLFRTSTQRTFVTYKPGRKNSQRARGYYEDRTRTGKEVTAVLLLLLERNLTHDRLCRAVRRI